MMLKQHYRLFFILFVSAMLLGLAISPVGELKQEPRPAEAHVMQKMAVLQIPFTVNEGQVDEEVSFYARTMGGTFFVTRDGEMVYSLGSGKGDSERGSEEKKKEERVAVLKERLLDALKIHPQGEERAETKVNFFIGSDQSKWKTDLPTYNSVSLGRVYENIDLSLKAYGKKVEKVFTVQPGGKVGDIRLGFEGVESVSVNAEGDLKVEIPTRELGARNSELGTAEGRIRFSSPVAFQEINDKRKGIQVTYDVRGRGTEYGFRVGEYDPRMPLIIDPKLEYSTYLGGSGDEHGNGMVVDNQGSIFIAGDTTSSNFPTKNPYQGTHHGGGRDGVVTKLNASGSAVIYSTYFGGSGDDVAQGIAVDGSGNVYICGFTGSADLPILTPYQGTYRGGTHDAFVAKLNAAGNALVYSTYLGGNNWDAAVAIAADASGNAYVCGGTMSVDFPTGVSPYQGSLKGVGDVFVTKLSPAGNSLIYSTYLGGTGGECLASSQGFTIDASGNAYICGYTTSTDFPTLTPYQGSYQGGTYDGFVTKLNATGDALLYSTYLGGSGEDYAYALAIDDSGNAYIGGLTGSGNFPTLNAYQGTYQGGTRDGFITELSPSGNNLIFSTYFGGSGEDYVMAIAIDQSKNIYVAGLTASTNLPTKNAFQEGFQGGSYDAFVSKFNPACNSLQWSTYLGGNGLDEAQSMTVEKGDVYLAGTTSSSNFPTKNPYQGAYGGGSYDAFVAKISPVTKAKMNYFSPVHNLKE
jgi:hypothetical protein